MENNYQFTRWKTPSWVLLLPHLDPVRKNSHFRVQAKSCFHYFSFLAFSLCSAWFCLPLSARGPKTCLPSLKLISTTVIVDAWYAQLVVYYCQQQVWTSPLPLPLSSLRLPTFPCGSGAALLQVEGSQANICSSPGSAYSTSSSSSSTHSKHNTAQQNIIKHECFECSGDYRLVGTLWQVWRGCIPNLQWNRDMDVGGVRELLCQVS